MSDIQGIRPTRVVVSPVDPSTVYITGFFDSTGDRILKSVNGGAAFALLPFTPDQQIHSLTFDPVAPHKLYAATGTPQSRDGRVFESTDGGTNWTPIGPFGAFFKPTAVAVLSSDVYVADADDELFVLRNGSTTWTPLGYAGITTLSATAGSTPALYAGTSSGAVWRIHSPDPLVLAARLESGVCRGGSPGGVHRAGRRRATAA